MKAPYYPPNSPLNALKTVIQSMSMLLTLDFPLRTSASSLPIKIMQSWFQVFWKLAYLYFCITFKSKSLRNNKKDKYIRTLELFFIQRSVLLVHINQIFFWLKTKSKSKSISNILETVSISSSRFQLVGILGDCHQHWVSLQKTELV